MSELIRQRLTAEVRTLSDLVKRLRQRVGRLTDFTRMVPEEIPLAEETKLAKGVRTDRQLLQRSIDRVNGMLRECFDHIQLLGDPFLKQAEEDLLAALPTFDDEQADPNVEEWPIVTLLSKAQLILDGLQVYIEARFDTIDAISSHSSSRALSDHRADDENRTHRQRQPIENARQLPNSAKTDQYPFNQRTPAFPPNNSFLRPSNRPTHRLDPNHGNLRSPTNDDDALRVSRIEIPRFSGSAEEWITFWAAFDFAVHSRQYPAFQKHLLLLQYLEKGSPPRRMIEGYPPSDANYRTVVNILRDRYGDVGNRRDQLNAQLLHLKPALNNLKELRQLQQEIERICTQLCSLEPEGELSPIANSSLVTNLIKSKLPPPVLLELIRMERESYTSWTARNWREGLATIVNDKEQVDLCVRTFQRIDIHPREPSPENASPPPRLAVRSSRQPPPPPDRRYLENTRTFATLARPISAGGISCSLCEQEGHRPSACKRYITIAQRQRRLEEQGRCLRCLRQDHVTRDCSRQDRCSKCQANNHHFLLCPSNDPPARNGQRQENRQWNGDLDHATGANAEPIQPRTNPTTTAFIVCEATATIDQPEGNPDALRAAAIVALPIDSDNLSAPKSARVAHLMTQTLKASCQGGPPDGIPAFVFHDPGSQIGYISRAMVKRLQPPMIAEQMLRIHIFGDPCPKTVKSSKFAIRLQRQDGGWETLELNVIDEIATKINALQWDLTYGRPPEGTELKVVEKAPDILIGIQGFWQFFTGRSTLHSGLHLIQTIFGPMIGGEAQFPETPPHLPTNVMLSTFHGNAKPPPLQRLHTNSNLKFTSSSPSKNLSTPLPINSSCFNMLTLLGVVLLVIQFVKRHRPKVLQNNPSSMQMSLPSTNHGPPSSPESVDLHKIIRESRRKPRLFTIAHTATMIIIIFVILLWAQASPANGIWPFEPNHPEPSPKSNCVGNHLNCTRRGVKISSNPAVQKVTICCSNSCFDRLAATAINYELSSDLLVNEYGCSATFSLSSTRSCTAEITCPAIDECELIDCFICIDQLANWRCNPRLSLLLLLIIGSLISCLIGWVVCFCSSARVVLNFGYQITALLLSWPLRLAFFIAGSPWTREDREGVAERLEFGVQKVRRQTRHQGRRAQRAATRLIGILLAAPVILSNAETISVTTHTESCLRSPSGLTCRINTATTLTLLPAGQKSSLILRDDTGNTIGTVQMHLHSLDMVCHQQSEAWLRSYHIEVLSVKRCPRAGSCRDDHCSLTRPQTPIPELKSVHRFPGNSFCQDSTSFWGNDCGLPASACLYYRYFARPTSARTFELISCPSWGVQLSIHLQIESAGGQNRQVDLTLHPGITTHWSNLSVTPLAISLPPLPTLGSQFVTDGRSVAIAERLPTDLFCPNEEAAVDFNCSLSLEACQECFPDHAAGSIECHCRDLDLDSLLENPERRLPLTTAKIRLHNVGPAIFATHAYSPIQLHIVMTDMVLHLQLPDSTCRLEEPHLVGCYSCSTGAQLDYVCHSDFDSPLATVICDDGQLFVASCSPNGTRGRQTLPYDHADVATQCQVKCPAGITTFRLNGTLQYIPRQRQFGHRQRTSEVYLPDPEQSSFWPDLGFDKFSPFLFFGKGPMILAITAAIAIGLIALILFLKYSPVFASYRILARLLMGLV